MSIGENIKRLREAKGFTQEQLAETDKYYPRLLKVVKSTPEFNNAAWLLQYQIESMIDIYKRLM